MIKHEVIDQLNQYRHMQARLKVLSTYSVGAGITVSRLNEDDQLQELHRKLRGMPSHMYLSKREQKLESAAHAYLKKYPAGIRAQLKEVENCRPLSEEDGVLLRELKGKIQKVFAARGYEVRSDIDAVLDRVAEFQDLQTELKRMDEALQALNGYKPEYAKLLRTRYIEGKGAEETAMELGIVRQTFHRWLKKAVEEYSMLIG